MGACKAESKTMLPSFGLSNLVLFTEMRRLGKGGFGEGGSCVILRSLSCLLHIHLEMTCGHLGIGV